MEELSSFFPFLEQELLLLYWRASSASLLLFCTDGINHRVEAPGGWAAVAVGPQWQIYLTIASTSKAYRNVLVYFLAHALHSISSSTSSIYLKYSCSLPLPTCQSNNPNPFPLDIDTISPVRTVSSTASLYLRSFPFRRKTLNLLQRLLNLLHSLSRRLSSRWPRFSDGSSTSFFSKRNDLAQ